ncbi:MAG: cache domain-containing protein [Rhodocyclaceae bacterium]|nr:cache domain-containing protein [Rhodocyclaceae bacterium]MBX3667822.1 cache domain-containing protein [Rhodocyclaceae bacterium]
MKRQIIYTLIAAACSAQVALAATPLTSPRAQDLPERVEARQATELLNRAVTFLQRAGADVAMPIFNTKGGPFTDGDLYVFVLRKDGVVTADGSEPTALVGKNAKDLRDAGGRPFVANMLEGAAKSGEGQVEFEWLNRVDNRLELKHLSYRLVGDYIVSVGYYIPHGTAEQAKALLERAVEALRRDGPGRAFTQFNNPHGAYVKDDLYVFVVGVDDGIFYSSPMSPGYVGTNATDLRDAAGKPIIREMVDQAKEKGLGSIDYVWRNPVSNKVENKHTLYQRVDRWLLGVGYYTR